MTNNIVPNNEQGFQSFFTPSPDLTKSLLKAGLNTRAVGTHDYVVLGKRRRAALLSLAQDDPQKLAQIQKEVATCLWRFLGTLCQRRQQQYLPASEELSIGLQERLGIPAEKIELVVSLLDEFKHWLDHAYQGHFLARWGEIALSGNQILLKPTPNYQEQQAFTDRAQVIVNYFNESEEKIFNFLSTGAQGGR